MKRILLLISILSLLLALPAMAQTTAVSGTVTDPNGLPYAFGTILPQFVNVSGGASPIFTATGFSMLPPNTPSQLSSTGTFSFSLPSNASLTPSSTQWKFLICSGAGSVPQAFGTGQQCFTTAAVTISGATQNITTNITGVPSLLTLGNIPTLVSCGTTTTCANSSLGNTGREIFGSCPFSAATTCAITGVAPAFTSSTSFFCIATDATNTGQTFKIANGSSSSFTITASTSNSDVVNYQCTGN